MHVTIGERIEIQEDTIKFNDNEGGGVVAKFKEMTYSEVRKGISIESTLNSYSIKVDVPEITTMHIKTSPFTGIKGRFYVVTENSVYSVLVDDENVSIRKEAGIDGVISVGDVFSDIIEIHITDREMIAVDKNGKVRLQTTRAKMTFFHIRIN
jgi:hypothetical protein